VTIQILPAARQVSMMMMMMMILMMINAIQVCILLESEKICILFVPGVNVHSM